jgi:hypothetical protein
MTVPFHEADGIRLLLGDARKVMRSLPAESVSCIMTSPPFWGLRSYSCEPSIWGGDPNCPHRLETGAIEGESYAGRQRWQHDGVSRQETPDAWVKAVRPADKGHLNVGFNERCGNSPGMKAQEVACSSPAMETATCSLCGAWRGQLGLEPTVGAYVEHTMEWLREAKRVLRKDGVAWIDLGDSRGGGSGSNFDTDTGSTAQGRRAGGRKEGGAGFGHIKRERPKGLPAKNLALIPQRIAIACQDEGWIVRSQIIIPSWMPESAKDRPTDSYRTVLMLVKSQRYWYDAQAVRVTGSNNTHTRASVGQTSAAPCETEEAIAKRGRLGVFTDGRNYDYQPGGLRNLGDIWDIPPAAYPDAHFATFATEEPETCIKASCPAEICVKCSKPRVRIVKKANVREHPQRQGRKDRNKADYDGEGYAERESGLGLTWDEQTVGWSDCGCNEGWVSGTVLDPFIGTGTTAVAARMLGRRAIGIDASEDYLRQAVTRLTVGDSGIRKIVAARRAGAEQAVML